jgi:hypothetical protein
MITRQNGIEHDFFQLEARFNPVQRDFPQACAKIACPAESPKFNRAGPCAQYSSIPNNLWLTLKKK